MLRRLSMIAIVAVFLGAGVGCSGQANSSGGHAGHPHMAENGDLQEKTASADQLPGFLDTQPEQVKRVYSLAAAHMELLGGMPCYCGCGESAGHISNLNCFIREVSADGAVVWDDHATRCGVCLEIAVKAAAYKQQGKSNADIRRTIDASYSKGYAEPTPTPLPG